MFGLTVEEIIQAVDSKRLITPKPFKPQVKGISLDSRGLKRGEAFLALRGQRFDAHDFLEKAQDKGASFLIAERIPSSLRIKIKIPVIIVSNTTKALGFIAGALRRKYSPFVCAVTGSLGKTTTKDMASFILEEDFSLIKNPASLNNHIGLPKTLLSLNPGHKISVLELGTNHFGEIAYLACVCKPDATIITCIDDVHLKYFKTRAGVLKEKTSVFDVCPGSLPILNADDPLLKEKPFKVKPLYFGRSPKNSLYFSFKAQDKDSLLFSINSHHTLRLNSLGSFNVYNALAALSLSLYVGRPLAGAVDKLSEFSFSKMRLQPIVAGGIRFINDAYNSNPAALTKGLKALDNIEAKRKIAVLGDMLELGRRSLYFHRKMTGPILKARFAQLIFVGKFMKAVGKSLIKKGFARDKVFFAKDASQAKDHLFRIAKKGDLVFLKGSRSLKLEKIIL